MRVLAAGLMITDTGMVARNDMSQQRLLPRVNHAMEIQTTGTKE